MNDAELLRYSRQIMLPEIDIAGQEALLAAKVLIVGLGGLGSPAAFYLAAAGVGSLVLCDDDRVDATNLQRQIVHKQGSLGMAKVRSAAERLVGDGLRQAVDAADVVVDATDNFATRYELNRACIDTLTPLVSGAAIRMEGQASVFDPREPDSPCYRCLYPAGSDEELNCSETGVIAPLVGMIGTVQAMETIKLITGVGETLTGHLLVLDAKHMDWRKLRLGRNPSCPDCGARKIEG
jgi:molybdopterin/thiamine biosynthesis adenylyltransferase